VQEQDVTPTRHGPTPGGIALVVSLAFGAMLLAEVFLAPPTPFGGVDNPGAWFPPRSRAELLVAKMDGHAFAQIAEDPTMAHTVAAYHGDETDAAYRASRPVMGWAIFATSAGGQRDLVAPAALLLTALFVGLVVLAVDFLGRALNLRVGLLLLVPVMPAMVAAAAFPGVCEPLACSLVLFGLGYWCRGRTVPAIVLLSAAALTRETMILVPLALGIDHLIQKRTLKGAWPLFIPPAVYGAWVAVVYNRIGALPTSYSPMDGPLVGFRQGLAHWRLAEFVTAAVLIASAVIILKWGTSWMVAILAVHAVFSVFMNIQVWFAWWAFGRVMTLLPLLAVVALARRRELQAADAEPPARSELVPA